MPANFDTLHHRLNGVALHSTGTGIMLSGSPEDTNSINRPRNVVPITTAIRHVKPEFNYTLPANSIVVLKLQSH